MLKHSFVWQYLATFSALLGVITSGMHYGWPSPFFPQLLATNSTIHISSSEGAWIATTQLLVPIPTCLLGALTVDLFGRKASIIFTALPFFASWLLITFATSPTHLFLARALAGAADGFAFTAIPMYVGEISDAKIRGLLGSSMTGSFTLGMLLVNILGSFETMSRTATIAAGVPLLLLGTFWWMPESPYFYIMKGKLTEARQSLATFRGGDNVDGELERLKLAIDQTQKEKGTVCDLWRQKGNRKGLFILFILRNAQQLSGNTAITFYAQTIFTECGVHIFSTTSATIVYFTIQCLAGIFCSVVIDRTGRRPLLIISLTGTCVTLFLLGTFFFLKTSTIIDTNQFNFVPITALIIYVILFNLGCQPMPLLMQSELFPTSVKGIATSLSEVYYGIVGAAVSKLFQMVKDQLGMAVPFWMFAALSACNFVLVVIFVPETKGKTLEDIQEELRQ